MTAGFFINPRRVSPSTPRVCVFDALGPRHDKLGLSPLSYFALAIDITFGAAAKWEKRSSRLRRVANFRRFSGKLSRTPRKKGDAFSQNLTPSVTGSRRHFGHWPRARRRVLSSVAHCHEHTPPPSPGIIIPNLGEGKW